MLIIKLKLKNDLEKQKLLDAPHLGASRYFGYLTGAPQQKVQTTTGGGK